MTREEAEKVCGGLDGNAVLDHSYYFPLWNIWLRPCKTMNEFYRAVTYLEGCSEQPEEIAWVGGDLRAGFKDTTEGVSE
jgi:hypothetical protein